MIVVLSTSVYHTSEECFDWIYDVINVVRMVAFSASPDRQGHSRSRDLDDVIDDIIRMDLPCRAEPYQTCLSADDVNQCIFCAAPNRLEPV